MEKWLRYFETNARRVDLIPWDRDEALSVAERRSITKSIAIFQLGESSEGRNLVRFAKEWGERHREPLLVPVTRYFIREEQRHAALLERFMRAQKIPLIETNWTDRVFRVLRKRAGYELSISVLVVAEILALVYYPALREATTSPVLRAACDQIVEEERAHVRYQVERIRDARKRHSRWRAVLTHVGHRFLYAGTVLVVFPTHRHVLRRGGLGFRTFWRRAWEELDGAFTSEPARLGRRSPLASPKAG